MCVCVCVCDSLLKNSLHLYIVDSSDDITAIEIYDT